MRIKKNQYLISPSDLNNFVTCKYIIKNNILFLNDKIKKKNQQQTKRFGKNLVWSMKKDILIF